MGWEEVSGDESRRSLQTNAMTEMRTKLPFADNIPMAAFAKKQE